MREHFIQINFYETKHNILIALFLAIPGKSYESKLINNQKVRKCKQFLELYVLRLCEVFSMEYSIL